MQVDLKNTARGGPIVSGQQIFGAAASHRDGLPGGHPFLNPLGLPDDRRLN